MKRIGTPGDEDKAALWRDYFDGRPARVPMRLNTNPRVVLLDPAWNPEGISFRDAATDPRTHVEVALRHELYRRRVVGLRSDAPCELPDEWAINMWTYNVYEAASLGAELVWAGDQVPTTRALPADTDKRSLFDLDIDRPLELPFVRDALRFWDEMERICRDLQFEGRPVRLVPLELIFSDGPLTVACNLFGDRFLVDLIDDPEYADELLRFLMRAAIRRRQAFFDHFGDRLPRCNGMADDSIALISSDMYRERLLPVHREYYEAGPAGAVRTMHLCGDATRHFGLIHEQLGVTAFDTGYPVDHGALRHELGEDVEITGGPEIALLCEGAESAIVARTESILNSGVKAGRRFVLQEGNNLPPRVPYANLDAMYRACLEHGGHEDA